MSYYPETRYPDSVVLTHLEFETLPEHPVPLQFDELESITDKRWKTNVLGAWMMLERIGDGITCKWIKHADT
jgi:hypothetical protein